MESDSSAAASRDRSGSEAASKKSEYVSTLGVDLPSLDWGVGSDKERLEECWQAGADFDPPTEAEMHGRNQRKGSAASRCGKPLPGEEQRVAKEQGWEAEAEPATVVAPRKPAVDPAVYYEQLIEDEEEWFREYQAVEDAALNDHLDTPQDHWHEATGPGDP